MRGKKERERAAQRGSENENNIPAAPDFLHSVKRHFLINAIFAFYLQLWAILMKSSSQVVFPSLLCVMKLHACPRPHVQYHCHETDVPSTQLWGSTIVIKTFLPIEDYTDVNKPMNG